jgi:DinB superfamily
VVPEMAGAYRRRSRGIRGGTLSADAGDGSVADLRYPIGRFKPVDAPGALGREPFLTAIADAPGALSAAVAGLTDAQLDTPYRPDGWTVRQVVHHVPDSHMNSYIRFRKALTEDAPQVTVYEEARWAELADARSMPVDVSLALLRSLHARWVVLLRSLTEEQWQRSFRHPEHGLITLERNLQLYAWHGRHHVAHITALRERMGW